MCLYLNTVKYSIRFHFFSHIAAAFALILFTPVLFGITALDATTIAYPLELALPFLGVIMLTPLYSFEKSPGILDTVRSRKASHTVICFMRIMISMAITLILICAFVLLMRFLESEVTILHALASYSNAVFLGSLGILAFAISGNIVIGYMIPVLYFAFDLMGGFKSFTIFSIMRNGVTEGKFLFFIIGIFLIAISLLCIKYKMKQILL